MKNCIRLAFLTLFGIFVLPSVVKASEITVCSSSCNYTDLASAVSAATSTDTIKLMGDIVLPSTLAINKTITIDLNGHTISRTNKVISVQGGNLTVTGTGTIKETVPDYGAISVKGSNNPLSTNYTVVTIGKDVILEAWAPVFITPYLSSGSPYAYGVVVNVNGTLRGLNDSGDYQGSGIYINGQIQHKTNYPVINLSSTAVVSGTGAAIYAAGYAEWNINGASITGIESGLGIKSGKFNITAATISCTGPDTVPTLGYSNGIAATGAAIQIESNSSYAGSIELSIDGGTYSSTNGNVLYEYLASGTDTRVTSISFKDGLFQSPSNKEMIKLSSQLFSKGINFISGGSYSGNPSDYLKAGYKTYQTSSGKYNVVANIIPTGTKTVSGIVTDGANATIQLKQGGVIVMSTVANSSGEYSFANVPVGSYNVSFVLGSVSTIKTITVADANVTLNVTMPTSGNIKVVVIGTDSPDVIIDKLDSVSSNENVNFVVEKKDNVSHTDVESAIIGTTTNTENIFFEFNLQVNNTTITETSSVIDIMLPFTFTGKYNLKLYRYHNGSIQEFSLLTTKPESNYVDQTYYIDNTNGVMHIYSSKFSTYGITYNDTPPVDNTSSVTDTSSSSVEEIVNPQTSDNIILYVLLSTISVYGIYSTIAVLKKKNN